MGAEVCSTTKEKNLETATKNKRKLAPESRLNQQEKCWRAQASVEQRRQQQNSE